MTTKEELAERRERWAQALESGKYKQTQEALRTREGYCCLGVACDLYAKEEHLKWESRKGEYSFNGVGTVLPAEVQQWLGLASSTGALADGSSLASRNDDETPFTEIAAIIRAAPEGLFDD